MKEQNKIKHSQKIANTSTKEILFRKVSEFIEKIKEKHT